MNRFILLDSFLLAIPVLIIYLIIKLSRKNFNSIENEIINLLMLFYLTSLSYLIWFQPGYVFEQLPYNFTLFSTIDLYYNQLTNGVMSFKLIFINLLGNLLITVPIGFWFSYQNFNKTKTILLALFIPVLFEFGQYILHQLNYVTRVVDIDDWLLNALGILIGYGLTELVKKVINIKNDH